MSKLRSVNTQFWSDPWIEELSPSEKLLYLYFITNEKTNMLGVYELSIKKISFETGLNRDVIEKALKGFETIKKVRYTQNYVILLNFAKHQNYNTNMKKSAIDVYNALPKELKVNDEIIDREKTLEGFERVLNRLGMVRKIEVESETELETELEDETETETETNLYVPPKVGSHKTKVLFSDLKIDDIPEDRQRAYQLAKGFYDIFTAHANELDLPKANLENADAMKWIREIELMIEKKEATDEQIVEVGKFLKTDSFWKPNVRSVPKLREKFENIYASTKKQINGKSQSTLDDPEFQRMVMAKMSTSRSGSYTQDV